MNKNRKSNDTATRIIAVLNVALVVGTVVVCSLIGGHWFGVAGYVIGAAIGFGAAMGAF